MSHQLTPSQHVHIDGAVVAISLVCSPNLEQPPWQYQTHGLAIGTPQRRVRLTRRHINSCLDCTGVRYKAQESEQADGRADKAHVRRLFAELQFWSVSTMCVRKVTRPNRVFSNPLSQCSTLFMLHVVARY